METLEEGQAKILAKARQILDAARRKAERQDAKHNTWQVSNRIDEMRAIVGYAATREGCYDDIVVLGNWNTINERDPETGYWDVEVSKLPKEVGDALETIGAKIEWCDEWSTCDVCNRAIRTSANGYGWKAQFWTNEECETTCENCTTENEDFATEYLEWLEGCPSRAVTIDIDLNKHGFYEVDTEYPFERGLHIGQADNPNLIARSLESLGVTRYVFKLDTVGQFDARFSVYVHEDETIPGAVIGDKIDTRWDGRRINVGKVWHGVKLDKVRDDVSPGEIVRDMLRQIP